MVSGRMQDLVKLRARVGDDGTPICPVSTQPRLCARLDHGETIS